MRALKLFVDAGLCPSMKEAKRMMKSGALKINDVVLDDESLEVTHVGDKLVIGNHQEDGTFLVHTLCISN